MTNPKTLLLFNFDWDLIASERLSSRWPSSSYGFDLFSFPSNARLAWFDIERFVGMAALRARLTGCKAVWSNQEQFGALCAAMLAQRMGWPGTPVDAVLACQHKLYAREILQQVAPEANLPFQRLEARYNGPLPAGIHYPQFVKPIKAAFSVLATTVHNQDELLEHTRFGPWELWVIRHLVEPFEKVLMRRLPQAGTAHAMLLEQPQHAEQFNLDGYVWQGQAQALGVVDEVMYPGTQCFMRFDYPSKLPASVQARALDVASRFLQAIGYTHGLFNMEFFYNPASDQLTVIEFNPRMASQFSDLYKRVSGIDVHEIAFSLAHGQDPALLPRHLPVGGAASSFVYRVFDPQARPTMPSSEKAERLHALFPDSLLFQFPKDDAQIARDFKWLKSYRYGILHLHGRDPADLQTRCEQASALIGWPAPYLDAYTAKAQQAQA